MPEARLKYFAQLSSSAREQFQRRVLHWYEIYGRDLPWRTTRDAYAIVVSEIMLHQTQVTTVLPVYEQFMRKFPTVSSLAEANLAEVKQITDPLGYKIRGSWLHEIARAVMSQWQGSFPRTVEDLMTLPGVGRYTAGAVMSFAYEEKAPILDTNVTRLLGRYFAIGYRKANAESRHRLWALADALVPDEAVHAFNQALMDLGAMVCTSRKPLCLTCPLYYGCQTGGPTTPQERAAEDPVAYQLRQSPSKPTKASKCTDQGHA